MVQKRTFVIQSSADTAGFTSIMTADRSVTLRLIVHGYLMTREVITLTFPSYEPPDVPQACRFQKLLQNQDPWSLCRAIWWISGR